MLEPELAPAMSASCAARRARLPCSAARVLGADISTFRSPTKVDVAGDRKSGIGGTTCLESFDPNIEAVIVSTSVPPDANNRADAGNDVGIDVEAPLDDPGTLLVIAVVGGASGAGVGAEEGLNPNEMSPAKMGGGNALAEDEDAVADGGAGGFDAGNTMSPSAVTSCADPEADITASPIPAELSVASSNGTTL